MYPFVRVILKFQVHRSAGLALQTAVMSTDSMGRSAVTVPFSSTEAADLLLDDQLIRWSVALNGSVTNCIV